MNTFRSYLIACLAALTGIAALIAWVDLSSGDLLQPRLPGQDQRPAEAAAAHAVNVAGKLIQGTGQPANLPGSWPGFRGPRRDGIVQEPGPLARQWPAAGPPVLWSIEVGEGHAGPVVQDGRVYLLDYDRAAAADALRCLSLADGREIWRYTYPNSLKRNHGMSRTVPAVADGLVVTLGPKCQVTCVDAVSGALRWSLDLVRDHGATVPQWYAGQCPLIDGGRVILAPGGKKALLLAVDLKTGRPLWQTPNPRGWEMTHSSVMPIRCTDRDTYVYCGSGGVAGVDARDGRYLWDTTDWKISIATVPSPVGLPDGRVFLSGGYNAGALMLRVSETNGTFAVQPLFRLRARQFGSTQHTPILHRGHLYGVREDKELCCLNLDGKVVWHSGSAHRFGLGPYLIAGDLLYVLGDEGDLVLAEASPAGFRPLARAKVLPGPDAWGPLALVNGRLLARDLTRLVCLDVRQPQP